MVTRNISENVSLATAARSQQWFEDLERAPQKWRGGGRQATLYGHTLEDFARRIGNPHQAAPREHWRNYNGHDLTDGAGKVSAIWYFDTPRGLVEVHDYWWNRPNELSINATDRRAIRWFKRWCATNGFKFYNVTAARYIDEVQQ